LREEDSMSRRSLHLLLLAPLLAAGCATDNKLIVSDLDTARLPEGTVEQWQDEQLEVIQARDEVARAELAVDDAKRELEVAEAEVKVADAEIDQAQKQLEAAQRARDDQATQGAEQQLEYSREKKRVAESHVQAQRRQVELAETRQELAETRQQLAQLRLNQAKLQALQEANDPAAQNYSAQDFDKAIAEQQQRLSQLRTEVESQQGEYTRARDEWQRQLQQLEANAPSTPAG
jgi:chromosome segregation ATPase